MARINIEEQAWKRAYRLAELMECTVREAIGTVACLWGNSQEIVKTHGTKSDILEWASLFKICDEDGDKWISALKNSRFISEEKNDLFKIHGNDIQLESRISKTNRASKGGKALKKKLAELKRLQADSKHSSSKPQAGSKGLNALQCNSIQGSSIQSIAIQGNLITENSTKSQKANAFVGAYCSRFKERWGHNPEILGKDAGIAKRLSKTLTLVKFELYLDSFFQMPDAWLAKQKHPLAAFESKLNEIVAFSNTGNFTTTKQVQQADDMASNMILLQKVREGKA